MALHGGGVTAVTSAGLCFRRLSQRELTLAAAATTAAPPQAEPAAGRHVFQREVEVEEDEDDDDIEEEEDDELAAVAEYAQLRTAEDDGGCDYGGGGDGGNEDRKGQPEDDHAGAFDSGAAQRNASYGHQVPEQAVSIDSDDEEEGRCLEAQETTTREAEAVGMQQRLAPLTQEKKEAVMVAMREVKLAIETPRWAQSLGDDELIDLLQKIRLSRPPS
eukprot:SM000296S11298  [mRNA]  locus=s296:123610:125015:- [translate_table: standard]